MNRAETVREPKVGGHKWRGINKYKNLKTNVSAKAGDDPNTAPPARGKVALRKYAESIEEDARGPRKSGRFLPETAKMW